MLVRCTDGHDRRYAGLDAAASTGALETVLRRVQGFLPSYSSVHRGAALAFAGRGGRDDIAIFCRNTTEAINHLAHSLRLGPSDTVVTTVVEHHANLLP
jgi:selenocysteine lyase/cysteine desulfurase